MAKDDLTNQAWLARFRATPFYESSGEESSLPDEAADRITTLEAENAKLRADNAEERAKVVAWLREQAVEARLVTQEFRKIGETTGALLASEQNLALTLAANAIEAGEHLK